MRTITRRLITLAAVLLTAGSLPAAPASAAAEDCEYPAWGDINADGQPELLVGIPGADAGAGAVDVFFDRAGAPTRVTAASLGFPASDPGDGFGQSVLALDLDQDGCSELVVGAPGAGSGAGRVYIAKGSPEGALHAATTIESPDQGARLGQAITQGWAGDGTEYLAVGGPGYDDGPAADAGAVYLVDVSGGLAALGTPLRVSQGVVGITPGADDRFGSVLSGNLAGVPDKDVGAATDAGAVVRLRIASVTLAGVVAQLWTQDSPSVPGKAEAGDRFGADVAGTWYVAVGVPGEDIGRKRDTGTVVLFRQTDATAAGSFRALKSYRQDTKGVPGVDESGDHFGAAVAVGDLESGESGWNLWIGAPGEDVGRVADAGTVTRIGLGGSRLPNAALSSGKGLPGHAEAGDALGAALGTVGDDYIMEEDGSTSLLVGVPGEDRGEVTDAGWVVFSRYSFDAGPRSSGLMNPAVAGERYGQVLPG
ncbi:MAG: FG-GAP repeat protein [Propionicimonas sp.]|uniref:hypothetical protein n=1 Tax=Propionicimonas sp. TaxID=1955623 RepID=UPI003D128797